jgi:hypothetical protein
MPTGYEIMQRAGKLLNDTAHIRWPATELCDWINEGVRAIVLAKPSANSRSMMLKLAAGARQSLSPYAPNPPDVVEKFAAGMYPLVLIGLVRNIPKVQLHPTYGYEIPAAYGRAIKRVDRALLDAQDPNWASGTLAQRKQEVRNYTFDEEVPTEFFVYPPNNGTGYVEAQVGALPRPIKAIYPAVGEPNPNKLTSLTPLSYNQNVNLPEPYSVPLLDYVLYRCQMKDDIDGAAGRSGVHYQQFATAIGMKLQVEQAHSPNTRR